MYFFLTKLSLALTTNYFYAIKSSNIVSSQNIYSLFDFIKNWRFLDWCLLRVNITCWYYLKAVCSPKIGFRSHRSSLFSVLFNTVAPILPVNVKKKKKLLLLFVQWFRNKTRRFILSFTLKYLVIQILSAILLIKRVLFHLFLL